MDKPKITVIDLLRAFWRGLSSQKWHFFVTIGTFVVANILHVFVPIFYKHFFDVISNVTDKSTAGPVLLGIIFSILIINATIAILFWVGLFTVSYYDHKTQAVLRQQAFSYLINHSYSFFSNNFTGSITQRVNRYARAFNRLNGQLLWTILPLSIYIGGVIIVLYFINPI